MKTCNFFKTLFLLALMVGFGFQAQGQYQSFFSQNSWEYNILHTMTCYTEDADPNAFSLCCMTFTYRFHHNDTVSIGSQQYYRGDDLIPFDGLDTYLREDTLTGQLYARFSSNESDEEYLLCDMSLSVGDTFILPEGLQWTFYGKKTMVVDSISYMSGYKVIHLRNLGAGDAFYPSHPDPTLADWNISLRFMEGLGPIFGIHPPESLETDLGLLLCMHKDDTLFYMTHEHLGCDQYGADIAEYPKSFMQVHPNPTFGLITLEFYSGDEVSGVVVIRDLTGRVCLQKTINNSVTSIDVSQLSSGTYILTYTGAENKTITKKIIRL